MTELNPKDQKPGYSHLCFCNDCNDLEFEALIKLSNAFVIAGRSLAYRDPFGDPATQKICDYPVTDYMYSLQYFFLDGYVDALHEILLSGDPKKYRKLKKAIRAKRKNKNSPRAIKTGSVFKTVPRPELSTKLNSSIDRVRLFRKKIENNLWQFDFFIAMTKKYEFCSIHRKGESS